MHHIQDVCSRMRVEGSNGIAKLFHSYEISIFTFRKMKSIFEHSNWRKGSIFVHQSKTQNVD